MKFTAYYQNGGHATFEWDGDLTAPDQMDDLLEQAYQEAPAGLCYHCSLKFEIGDDTEVYQIKETESGKDVFSEPTWDERLRKDAYNVRVENGELRKDLAEARQQRFMLADKLRQAGFTVDPDTWTVS